MTSQLPYFRILFGCMFLSFLISCDRKTAPPDIDKRRAIDSLNAVIVQTYERGEIKKADSLLDTVFFLPEYESRYALKKYYARLGSRRYNQGRFDDALKISHKYLSIIDTTNAEERFEYATELTSHGSIHFQPGNYNSAYRYYFDARRMFADSPCFVGYSDYSIAMVLYRQGDYEKSAEAFKRAYRGYERCDYSFEGELRKQEIMSNTGLCYFNVGRYDSALFYFDEAKEVVASFEAKKREDRDRVEKWSAIATGVISGNKARVFLAKGDLDSAYHHAIKAVSINLRPSYDQRDGLLILLLLADLHWKAKKVDEIDTVLRLARAYLDTINSPEATRKWLDIKLKVSKQKSQWDSAAYFAGRYITLADSLYSAHKEIADKDISLAMQSLDSEYQLGLLEKENEYRRQSVGYLWIILALAALAIIVSVVFLVSTRHKNRVLSLKSKDLEAVNKELQHRNTEKDRILEIAAHDLRTPIGAILSLSQLLKNDDISSEGLNELVDLIETAGQSSLELINEILLLADLKRNDLDKKPVAVNSFLKKTIELIKFKAAEKKQNIELALLDYEMTVEADPERLRRALSNLISNAIKFSHDHSDIMVGVRKSSTGVVFSVADHGIGIPKKINGDLFKSFTKAKREGTNGERPFGLGLSIVKQIAEGHFGKVWFESDEGRGSVFYIEIPAN